MSSEMVLKNVETKLTELQGDKDFHFPTNYSPQNALKSAWLILQNTKDTNKKPVLETCAKESIQNALFDMLIQGLSPAKKQCYFIAYGKQLTLQRSYFGTMAVTKRMSNVTRVLPAQVVYDGDEFEYAYVDGVLTVTKHIPELENVNKTKIKAAYQVITDEYGINHAFIMTMKQIEQAWKQSKMSPFQNGKLKSGSVHEKFTEEMAKKTVINRACKVFLNTSDDSDLFLDAIHRTTKNEFDDENTVEAEAEIVLANPVQEKIDAALSGFAAIGVSKEEVESFIGSKAESFTEANLGELREFYRQCRNETQQTETETEQDEEPDLMPTGYTDSTTGLAVLFLQLDESTVGLCLDDSFKMPMKDCGEFGSTIDALKWLEITEGFEAAQEMTA